MLGISPEKVGFVAAKAREFESKAEPVDREIADEDEGDDYTNDSTYQELKGFLDGLNEEEQANLVALVWLGRGDYVKEEWDEIVSTARSRRTNPTPDYLLGIPLLPDYLEEGMSVLGYAIEDFE